MLKALSLTLTIHSHTLSVVTYLLFNQWSSRAWSTERFGPLHLYDLSLPNHYSCNYFMRNTSKASTYDSERYMMVQKLQINAWPVISFLSTTSLTNITISGTHCDIPWCKRLNTSILLYFKAKHEYIQQ